jgi:hypothetical protein
VSLPVRKMVGLLVATAILIAVAHVVYSRRDL